MLVNASLCTYSIPKEKLTDDYVARVKICFPEAYRSGDYLYRTDAVVDVQYLQSLLEELDIKAEILPVGKDQIFTLQKRDGLEKRLQQLEADATFLRDRASGIMQVHVPNMVLLTFNKVLLVEDCCTDLLQGHLDCGWRIVAVCGPISERRPTYILGKYEMEKV